MCEILIDQRDDGLAHDVADTQENIILKPHACDICGKNPCSLECVHISAFVQFLSSEK